MPVFCRQGTASTADQARHKFTQSILAYSTQPAGVFLLKPVQVPLPVGHK
jgi:hypothetical protein